MMRPTNDRRLTCERLTIVVEGVATDSAQYEVIDFFEQSIGFIISQAFRAQKKNALILIAFEFEDLDYESIREVCLENLSYGFLLDIQPIPIHSV